MSYLSYLFFRIIVFLFRITPFRLLYIYSNIVAWLFHKVVKYRTKVINSNINLVYPKISTKERKKLIHAIYRNLSDITLEGIKGITMSDKQVQKRHRWLNPEILDKCHEEGKSVILAAGHYNNWEWGAFSPNFYLKHTVIGFYKPMTNPYINNYFIEKRGNTGTVLADINETRVYFEDYASKQSIFLMAADQSPTKPELAIWTTFLGVDTPCLHGLEKYAKSYDLPMIFCNIQRVKRGYYEITLDWIDEHAKGDSKPGELTTVFMKKLEKMIVENPASWLWSHRRWKHTKSKDSRAL